MDLSENIFAWPARRDVLGCGLTCGASAALCRIATAEDAAGTDALGGPNGSSHLLSLSVLGCPPRAGANAWAAVTAWWNVASPSGAPGGCVPPTEQSWTQPPSNQKE
jgi:hypothetical protein